MPQEFERILARYLPTNAVPQVAQWISVYKIQLKITKKRSTKLGDYRAPVQANKVHKITINGDLNPYAFLFVFMHELAHLIVWLEHGHKHSPHGTAWKNAFSGLLLFALGKNFFPKELVPEIAYFSQHIQASGLGNPSLLKAFRRFDSNQSDLLYLEELPDKSFFGLPDGRVFQKGPQLRKRFRCQCMRTGRFYLFHPMAGVIQKEKLTFAENGLNQVELIST